MILNLLVRMAAPDSPWISGGWKPDTSSDQYQSLWAQNNQENQGLKRTSESEFAITAALTNSISITSAVLIFIISFILMEEQNCS